MIGFLQDVSFAEPSLLILGQVALLLAVVWIITIWAKLLLRPRASKHSRYKLFARELAWSAAIIIAAGQVFVLARPQVPSGFMIATQPIDIVVVVDDSASMAARDVKPSRLELARDIINEFAVRSIKPGDRVTLIRFGRTLRERMPLSIDKNHFLTKVSELVVPKIYYDDASTDTDLSATLKAIPEVLDAQDRFEHHAGDRRVVLLLSDGDDEGRMDSIVGAAAVFRDRHIPVYTIGIGTLQNTNVMFKVEADNKVEEIHMTTRLVTDRLARMAEITSGQMITATSNTSNIQSFMDRAVQSNRPMTPHLVSTGAHDVWWPLSVSLFVLLFLVLVI